MRGAIILATALAGGSTVFAAPAIKRETNLGGLFGPLGRLIGKAPVVGIGGKGQTAVADAFKLGDVVLNIPADAVRKILQGDPAGAGTGLLEDIAKAASDLPKDAMGLVTPLPNSDKSN